MRKEKSNARKLAQREKLATFSWDCGLHGITDHDTHGGFCKLCEANLPWDMPPQIKALNLHARFFLGHCPTHGLVDHHARGGRCASCYDNRHRLYADRLKHKSLRQRARLDGASTYTGLCGDHGMTAFSVNRGQCLQCFNTAGARRSNAPGRPIGDGVRAVARRKGARTYVTHCTTHGEADHSVQLGKCLSCFTAMGTPRKGRSSANGARAVARRAGELTYLDYCDEHGQVAHSVKLGRCLHCYTAVGVRRVRPLA